MMLKDYSAPVRQLVYTATDPMASLHRSLAYTLKLISWAFYTDMLAVWGSYTCRFKYSFTLQVVFMFVKTGPKWVWLLSFKCLFSFLISLMFLMLLWRLNVTTALHVYFWIFSLTVSDAWNEKILLVFRVHSWSGNDFMSTARR